VAKYNYGRPDYNVMHYGEARPPVYNLSNIPHDLPLFFSYGGRDALSNVRDVMHLLDDLRFLDVDKLSVQFIKDYAHVDFIMGVNAKDIVYNQVVSFFKGQH
jgi:lysosomal acid lipase/cholesteryl ester hydrolase